MKEIFRSNRIKIITALVCLSILVAAEIAVAVSLKEKSNKMDMQKEAEMIAEPESVGKPEEKASELISFFPEDDSVTKWEETNPDWREPFRLSEISEDVILRVLIDGQDYASKYHSNFSIKAKDGFAAYDAFGEKKISFRSGQEVPSSKLKIAVGETVRLQGNAGELTLTSLKREQGTPTYSGILYVTRYEEGYIIVNHVPLEQYLYSVVPSEMPSRYPKEALKSQAVSARTYAYFYHLNPGLEEYGADMDDSVSFQVYNNIQLMPSTTEAVDETKGVILMKGKTVYPTFFFSTSCGNTTNEGIWREYVTDEEHSIFHSVHITKEPDESYACFAEINSAKDLTKEEAMRKLLSEPETDAVEAGEPYYRWNITVPVLFMDLYGRIKECADRFPDCVFYTEKGSTERMAGVPDKMEEIKAITITRRLEGGVADELCVQSGENYIYIEKEYSIRMVLSDGRAMVKRQDGSEASLGTLLPSGFFVLDCKRDKSDNVTDVIVSGGGLGHGVGMSQNGAKCLAEAGADYKEILGKFY